MISNSKSDIQRGPIYLYGPSESSARELGMLDWFERIARDERSIVIEDTSEAISGTLISFRPVLTPQDTRAELGGKVDRWLALDDTGNISQACMVSRKAGVERVFHKRLADEMKSPVSPAAMLYLESHGIWLPDTLDFRDGDAAGIPEDAKSPDTRNLLFACDREFVERLKLGPLVSVATEALGELGWKATQVDLQEGAARWGNISPSHVVVLADDPSMSLTAAAMATRRSAQVASCADASLSPLQYAFRGARIPYPLGSVDGNLRQFFSSLLPFLDPDLAENAQMDSELADQTADLEAFLFNESAFKPAIMADLLSSDEGSKIVSRAQDRLQSDPAFIFSPLYYAREFFRQYPPYRLLCDPSLAERCRPGIDRLGPLLELGFEVAGKSGAMHTLYLGWIDLLQARYGRIADRLLDSRDPKFSAISGYAAELAIGLWYADRADDAKACIEAALSLDSDPGDWPCRFQAAHALLIADAERVASQDLAKRAIESRDWVAIVGSLIAMDDYRQDIWSEAESLDRVSTEAFARALGIHDNLKWRNEY